MNEEALIEELFAPLATAEGADKLGDDAATFPAGEGDVVVTCDALAAGVHFFADDPPEAIAAKALRVNLSDLAAKGAEPFAYLLALALGTGWTADWVRRFASGLQADNEAYGVSLLGGDTLRAAGGTTIAVTAFGRVPAGAVVRRRTAKLGDVVTITGTVGDAALGLLPRLGRRAFPVDEAHRCHLDGAYLWPDPPVAGWRAVRAHATAAMDISDGLLGDLGKLCRAAGVGAEVDVSAVPLSPAVRAVVAAMPETFDRALTGGDDYQILATMPEEAVFAYRTALSDLKLSATVIGRIIEGSDVTTVRDGRTVTMTDGRYVHF